MLLISKPNIMAPLPYSHKHDRHPQVASFMTSRAVSATGALSLASLCATCAPTRPFLTDPRGPGGVG